MKGTILKVGTVERMAHGGLKMVGWEICPDAHFTMQELWNISQSYRPGSGPLTFGQPTRKHGAGNRQGNRQKKRRR